MDAETRLILEDLEARLSLLRNDLQWKIRDNAAWRSHWSAELDALIAEVALLTIAVRALEERTTMPDDQRSQNERIREAVQAANDAFVEVLFELLPSDRQAIKERFRETLGTLWAEVIGGATTMAAGTVVALDKRITTLEEKQVGGNEHPS